MSLLIFAGIVVGFPQGLMETFQHVSIGERSILNLTLLAIFMVVVIAFVVLVERAQRRIPIQVASSQTGRRRARAQTTHLPLKVNMAGVMPVIFASAIIALPTAFASLLPDTLWMTKLTQQLGGGMPLYTLLYASGIVFFCYFYTSIIFNTDDVADNMRKYGRYVPGIRPGKRTATHLDWVLTRLTFGGAVYLAAVAVLPEFLIGGFRPAPIPFIGAWLDSMLPAFVTEGLGLTFYFGGTSLLIVVSVAMDTAQQIESRLIMRHYDGFIQRRRTRKARF